MSEPTTDRQTMEEVARAFFPSGYMPSKRYHSQGTHVIYCPEKHMDKILLRVDDGRSRSPYKITAFAIDPETNRAHTLGAFGCTLTTKAGRTRALGRMTSLVVRGEDHLRYLEGLQRRDEENRAAQKEMSKRLRICDDHLYMRDERVLVSRYRVDDSLREYSADVNSDGTYVRFTLECDAALAEALVEFLREQEE